MAGKKKDDYSRRKEKGLMAYQEPLLGKSLSPNPWDAQRDVLSTKVALQARSIFSLFLARDQKYLSLWKPESNERRSPVTSMMS